MSAQYRSFAYRVDIDAPVERVWRAFTDTRLLARWCAEGANVVPREKGRMHVQFGEGVELDAHIDVLVTPQRLRLILLPTPGMPGKEAVIVEDFLFEKKAGSTALRLLSSGIPSSQAWVTYYLTKRRYWELALTRLKVFLEKGLDENKPASRT
ncbi:MAG TPA: SRPBCC domain-containing protein [Steroidobacteraceae bacterium]|nr:SRPBCC domain-containing protein [Steroidobacteraceae bacterium]